MGSQDSNIDGDERDSGFYDVDCLLPNGFMVGLRCSRTDSIGQVKKEALKQALELPHAGALRNHEHYVVIGVTKDAEEKELEPTLTLDESNLVAKIVEISEPKQQIVRLLQEIEQAIGMPISLLDKMSGEAIELRDVRIQLKQVGERIGKDMENWDGDRLLEFFHPPKLDLNSELPISTTKIVLKEGRSNITVKVVWRHEQRIDRVEFEVPVTSSPKYVVRKAEAILNTAPAVSLSGTLRKQQSLDSSMDLQSNFVLKRFENDEFFLQDCGILAYEYIRDCLTKDIEPHLEIVDKNGVIEDLPNNACAILKPGMPVLRMLSESDVAGIFSWHISQDKMYRVVFRNIPVETMNQADYDMEVQLFHGKQPLSKAIKVTEYNVKVSFDVPIDCLPRYARLCVTVIRREPNNENKMGVRWFNMQVFDHNGVLRTGKVHTGAFEFPRNVVKENNPFGTPLFTDANIRNEKLVFEICEPDNDLVRFPSEDEINEYISTERHFKQETDNGILESCYFQLLDRIHAKEILTDLTSKEKENLWKIRHLALEYQPQLLPRLIQCVTWTNRHQVFELYQLIEHHQVQSLEVALQLIGPEYPDARIRSLALCYFDRELTIELLELFLLQFVQALLFESYQFNDLAVFLLKHSLEHKTIGHKLFWMLRSEMNSPVSRQRFAPLLESYCFYCGSALLSQRIQEVATMESLHKVAKLARQDVEIETLEEALKGIPQNRSSLLRHRQKLQKICLERCKVMTSKMRPIWLSWWNKSTLTDDPLEKQHIDFIVKIGDDMRQDMLCLQLLKVMDMLWKYTLNDYHMTVYGCMSLGEDFGLIEAVLNCTTVNEIHMSTDGRVLTPMSIHQWIYEQTGGGENYIKAIRRFKMSCAACVVAVNILGIGDRHPSNIMVKKTGEMFHIDFGHFMGHVKTKAGIRRERTPFVLTKDFMNAVTGGDAGHKEKVTE
ncbi:PK3CA-like protein [Mya arenaria]|uniref:PK3CA-like protein n=2 Tax=Mya arenaria TaxID=6604 RepID=A0ABY7F0N6_MYAAR|nr:PK3CA-like protein [Mya arenaria]